MLGSATAAARATCVAADRYARRSVTPLDSLCPVSGCLALSLMTSTTCSGSRLTLPGTVCWPGG